MEEIAGVALVYTTFPSTESAAGVGRALVEARLAACVNIFPGMIAIFEWDNKLEQANEVAMLIKTRAELAGRVMEEVKKLHPYDTPAVLVIDVEACAAPYLEWLLAQTLSPDGK